MGARRCRGVMGLRLVSLLVSLALAGPVIAQDGGDLQSFRGQYDAMMSNFERIFAAQGDVAGQERAQQGREAMQSLSDQQLAALFAKTGVPDLSEAVVATESLAATAESEANSPKVLEPRSLPFPEPITLISQCSTDDVDVNVRYTRLIAKEVTSSILAAATFVCTQDILGENGSAACIPFAIAADIANGFFDQGQFCAGEVTANQVDANFRRLDHIHTDLADGITLLGGKLDALTAEVDIMRRAMIEEQLNTNSGSRFASYFLPAANGGMLEQVRSLVGSFVATFKAAGYDTSSAENWLAKADAAFAAGNFRASFESLRQAYRVATVKARQP